MATIYVDPSLLTNGDGTFETPYNTWAAVTWTAGNTYLQKENTVYNAEVTISNPGTVNARIYVGTYLSADGSITTNKGKQAKIIGDGTTGYALGLNPSGSRNYIDVNNLWLVAAETGAQKYGFYAYNSTLAQETNIRQCTIKNCTIESPAGTGVAVSGRGWVIQNNTIYNCLNDGIFLRAMDYVIDGNYIYDCDKGNSVGDAIQHSCLGNCNTAIIKNNVIRHPLGGVKQAIIFNDVASGGFVHVYDNVISGGGGACISAEVSPSIIERNVIDGRQGTNGVSFITSNVTVRSNLILNCTSSFIFTVDNCTNINLYNNTIVDTTQRIISQTTGITGNDHIFKNNLVINCGTADTRTFSIATSNTFTHDYNCYSGFLAPFSITGTLYTSYIAYVTGTSEDSNSLNETPTLTQQYYPKVNSVVINAGSFINKYRDLNNNVFSTTPSIGAYEYVVERGTR